MAKTFQPYCRRFAARPCGLKDASTCATHGSAAKKKDKPPLGPDERRQILADAMELAAHGEIVEWRNEADLRKAYDRLRRAENIRRGIGRPQTE